MPIIVTPQAVYGLEWGNGDTNFSYIENKKIIVRSTDQYRIVRTLDSPGDKFVKAQFVSSAGSARERIIAQSDDGSMYFWPDPYTEMSVVSGYDYVGKIHGIAFSKNGNYIAFGDRFGDIHVLRQHQVLKNEFTDKVIEGVKSPVYTLSFSDDSRYLVTGTQTGMAYVWNVNTYKLMTSFTFYSKKNQQLVFDGDKIIYPVDKDVIGIRDVVPSENRAMDSNSLTTIRVSSAIVDFDMDSKGQYLVVVNDKNGMDYIDVKNRQYIGSLPPLESGRITSVKLDMTGKRALIGDHKGEIFLFNLDDYVEKSALYAPTIQTGGAAEQKTPQKLPPKKQPEKKTVPKKAVEADKYLKYRKGHSIEIDAAYMLGYNPYSSGGSLTVGYMYANLPVPSMYVGAKTSLRLSSPNDTYPYQYSIGTQRLQNPYLFEWGFGAPIGFFIVPFKNPDFYFREEISVGFTYLTLWNGSMGRNSVSAKGGVTLCIGDTLSFGWKDLLVNVSAGYNIVSGYSFGFGIGCNKKLMRTIKP